MAGGLINRAPGYYGDELHRKSVIPAQLFRRSLFPPLPNHHIRLIGENKWDFFVPGCITPLNRSIQLCTFIWGHRWLPALDQGEEPQSPCMQLMSSGPCFCWETAGSDSISSTKQQWPQLFLFLGFISSQELRLGQGTLRSGHCFLPAPQQQHCHQTSLTRGPTALLTALCRGRGIREAQNTAQGWKSTVFGVFFSTVPLVGLQRKAFYPGAYRNPPLTAKTVGWVQIKDKGQNAIWCIFVLL